MSLSKFSEKFIINKLKSIKNGNLKLSYIIICLLLFFLGGEDERGQNLKVIYSLYLVYYLYYLIKLIFIYQTVSFGIYYFMSIFHFSS